MIITISRNFWTIKKINLFFQSREHQSLKFNKEAPGEPISSAIVKYNYQAQQLDELSLSKGARILILEKSGDGWWRGQYGNKIGWFPSNYTQEELEDAHTYCMAENVFDIMVALYTFKVSTYYFSVSVNIFKKKSLVKSQSNCWQNV